MKLAKNIIFYSLIMSLSIPFGQLVKAAEVQDKKEAVKNSSISEEFNTEIKKIQLEFKKLQLERAELDKEYPYYDNVIVKSEFLKRYQSNLESKQENFQQYRADDLETEEEKKEFNTNSLSIIDSSI